MKWLQNSLRTVQMLSNYMVMLLNTPSICPEVWRISALKIRKQMGISAPRAHQLVGMAG